MSLPRHIALTSRLTVLVVIAAAVVPRPAPAQTLGQKLLSSINQTRQSRDLPLFRHSITLDRVARDRVNDMIRRGYFGHMSPSGQTYLAWLRPQPVRFSRSGENIALNLRRTSAVIDAWSQSGIHRQNLLSRSYTHIGTAVARGRLNGRPVILSVAIFGQHIP